MKKAIITIEELTILLIALAFIVIILAKAPTIINKNLLQERFALEDISVIIDIAQSINNDFVVMYPLGINGLIKYDANNNKIVLEGSHGEEILFTRIAPNKEYDLSGLEIEMPVKGLTIQKKEKKLLWGFIPRFNEEECGDIEIRKDALIYVYDDINSEEPRLDETWSNIISGRKPDIGLIFRCYNENKEYLVITPYYYKDSKKNYKDESNNLACIIARSLKDKYDVYKEEYIKNINESSVFPKPYIGIEITISSDKCIEKESILIGELLNVLTTMKNG